jgi:hypothetical protein
VVSKKNPLAKLTRIHPEKLRDKTLLGLGADKQGCAKVYRRHPKGSEGRD